MEHGRKTATIDDYMAIDYPMQLVADEEGGYTVIFSDLPGCMTQIENLEELAEMASDARRLWIETELEAGTEIPSPSYPAEYSGKFVLRVARTLHRSLADSAEAEGVSLNQYVATLLARGDAQARIERKLDAMARRMELDHPVPPAPPARVQTGRRSGRPVTGPGQVA